MLDDGYVALVKAMLNLSIKLEQLEKELEQLEKRIEQLERDVICLKEPTVH